MLVMQKVQKCPWHSFKFHEIVTLEKCLHEASAEDPRINLLLKKLVTESVFVETDRKKLHLERDANERRRDSELHRKTVAIRAELAECDQKLRVYLVKIDNLSARLDGTKKKIVNEAESVEKKKKDCQTLIESFALTYERSHNSFINIIPIIQFKIPEFLDILMNSDFCNQFNNLPELRRNYLIQLIRCDRLDNRGLQLLGYNKKIMMSTQMREHLEKASSLLIDLMNIFEIYRDDVQTEIGYLKSFKSALDNLQKIPIREPEKQVFTEHLDLKPLEQPNIIASIPDSTDFEEFLEYIGT